jgi:hypothetical protein
MPPNVVTDMDVICECTQLYPSSDANVAFLVRICFSDRTRLSII